MSGQHWIDALFRKRLKQQEFPVEAGEFEEMRALLEQRNATTAGALRSGISKWWLSALIPIAGLLWWTFGGSGGSATKDVPFTAQYGSGGTNIGEQRTPVANDIHARKDQEQLDPTVTGTEVSAAVRSAAPAATDAVNAQVDPVVDESTAQARRDRPHGGMAATDVDRKSVEALAAPATGIDRNDRRTGLITPAVRVDDPSVGSERASDEPAPEVLAVRPGTDERNDVATTIGNELRETRAAVLVDFMELRAHTPLPAAAPEPIQGEVPVLQRLPVGALHFFGAPLAVRVGSGAEAGSLFGLEYRMRAKRFVWATGIHYGSYTLKADGGATDVKLNFVEVPLLGSFQLSRGRFGLALQGGVSVDLLFNSRGRYRVEGDRNGSAFPDDAFRTANLSLLLRPQVNYHVNEHLSVNGGPLWKTQLGDVAKAGPLEGARVSSTGVAIGITWRLDHSTF